MTELPACSSAGLSGQGSSLYVPGDAVSLSDPGPVFITCLPEAVFPWGLATDLESVDYTCSPVAIIKRMTQHVSMGKDGGLFKSSIMGLDGERAWLR